MATVNTLTARIRRIIQDDYYTSADILALLNQGQREVAGGVTYDLRLPPTPPLPDLLTQANVSASASTAYVALPSDFHRNLFHVVDSDDWIKEINHSWIDFLKSYPGLDESGTVAQVCVRGNRLYFQPRQNTTLTIHYNRRPTDMSASDDEPDGIPWHLQERVLVSYVCRELFDEIEDGIEGQKVNFQKWNATFEASMAELYRYLGPPDGEPDFTDDDEDYIGD